MFRSIDTDQVSCREQVNPVFGIPTEHVPSMVRRTPPTGAPVVAGSTPVVAFGDPANTTVATLGINPSRVEFVVNGTMLTGAARRLATLDSLHAASLATLTDAQVATVVSDCSAYFRRNPYRRWFDPLDGVLREATHTSYYDGTACHLDLVQWATDPVWGAIGDHAVRRRLLDDGVPHLREQLKRSNIELVLLNGRQVLTQVRNAGLASLTECGLLTVGHIRCQLFHADSGSRRWIGWSANLQSGFGISKAFKLELAKQIADLAGFDVRSRWPVGEVRATPFDRH